ncbi:hypothetical protein TBLA_0D04670 [Henningerozyma blattae CBS 6284]|uniref:SCD domain-containing protein n=1 Tax=Henningerozyma blattae (strain ATCC 34711 / CBS 6284 / DSM 70876 / NBRC 10599 / NRRL Y-10934 / UCD 77-7) TaxID=1071380 RepID=I2H3L1_HENB6|nr:hypothetical protein TBLA_0D04670 [Tetrapisispora blattae CBS 6284]CCH60963.1 hypothetical protein TBLA_0D04670 [Tetrapisispora blattae CBS 6284]
MSRTRRSTRLQDRSNSLNQDETRNLKNNEVSHDNYNSLTKGIEVDTSLTVTSLHDGNSEYKSDLENESSDIEKYKDVSRFNTGRENTNKQISNTDRKYTADPISDDEDDDEEEEEPSNNSDEDYQAPGERRRSSRKRGSIRDRNSKKIKRMKTNQLSLRSHGKNLGSKEDQEQYIEMIHNFEPTELFEILCNSEDISINELLREKLEEYQSNRDKFISEFINLILCCCGVIARVEEHDVRNNDLANETVSELQSIFQKQKIHEFHLLLSKTQKKKAKYPNLYPNFMEFMSKMMDMANELQMLSVDDDEEEDNEEITMKTGHFVIDLLTWLASFSVCKIRCFRYISTSILYSFQDSIVQQVFDLNNNYLLKLNKQLANEQKKKRSNKKTIAKLEKTLNEIEQNKMVMQSIIDNIIKLCFIHRFKDIDELIRSDSMYHLANWIQVYPEFFLKVSYLKYFGWLLSDTSVEVRLQILKILPYVLSLQHASNPKIKKGKGKTKNDEVNQKKFDNSSIRQFFERFQERIIEIAINDENLDIRINAVQVLNEVVTLGYMEDTDAFKVISLIFNKDQLNLGSKTKRFKFMNALASFFTLVVDEKIIEFNKNYKIPKKLYDFASKDVIRIGTMMKIINMGMQYHVNENLKTTSESRDGDGDINLENNSSNNVKDISSSEKVQRIYQTAEFLSLTYSDIIGKIGEMLTYEGEYENTSNVDDYNIGNEEDEEQEEEDNEGERNDIIKGIKKYLLLPYNQENTILYLTVLNGLINGNAIKGKEKMIIGEMILPQIEKLIKFLPMTLKSVYMNVFEIFVKFEYKEWIDVGLEENDILGVITQIIKVFNEISIITADEELGNLGGEIDLNKTDSKIFCRVFQHIKNFQINTIDEIMINNIDEIKLQFDKYLDEQLNIEKMNNVELEYPERVGGIFDKFLNKLVIFGKEYNIEFEENEFNKFNENFLTKINNLIENFDDSTIKKINFKIFSVIVQWRLKEFEEMGIKSKMTVRTVEILNTILMLFELRRGETDKDIIGKIFMMKWKILNVLIDVIISIKVYDIKEGNNGNDLMENIPYLIQERNIEVIKQIFLAFESYIGTNRDLQLEREDQEDVNINDDSEIIMDRWFGSNKEIIERNFLIFTIKVKSLFKIGILDDNLLDNRMKLNSEKLGKIFSDIINDEIFSDATTTSLKNRTEGEI